jgi:hypothetical protein
VPVDALAERGRDISPVDRVTNRLFFGRRGAGSAPGLGPVRAATIGRVRMRSTMIHKMGFVARSVNLLVSYETSHATAE